MNYIWQQTLFYRRVEKDPRIKPLHISLYMALFQVWNSQYFAISFLMNRTQLMKMSRIGSKTTFAKTIKELHEFKYITYDPARYTKYPAKVTMTVLRMDSPCTTNGTAPVYKNVTAPDPELGRINKTTKTIINDGNSECVPHTRKRFIKPSEEEVQKWFAGKKVAADIALAFFLHYTANGWKMGKATMVDWNAAADKWILTTKKVTTNNGAAQYLHTDKYKDYSEPL